MDMSSKGSQSTKQQKCKVVFLGDSAVGKSSILERIINGRFDERKQQTIAIDFLKKQIVHRDKFYQLLFWDTAGQQKYQSLVSSYVRDVNCIIFVFDVNNQKSFQNMERWLQIFKQNKTQDASMILVANKTDIVPRMVKSKKCFQWALKHKMTYCQTSAKTGKGIEQIMNEIVNNIDKSNSTQASQIDPYSQNIVGQVNQIQIDSLRPKKHACCYI